jgi:hypothetical protein
MRRLLTAAAATAVVVSIGVAAVPSGAEDGGPEITVAVSGLDNPRQLVATSDALYVAESGRGGDAVCFESATGPVCAGASGRIIRLAEDGVTTVVDGLPSHAGPEGLEATGPAGLSLADGVVWAAMGGPTTADRDVIEQSFPEAGMLGQVGPIDLAGGGIEPRYDAWRFEQVRNPDQDLGNPKVDSNPVDVAVDGDTAYIVDAGGNSLLKATSAGIEILSVFANRLVPNPVAPPGAPPVPMNAVPTAVAIGPDGFLYVTQLTGFPFPVGGANVYKVDPVTGTQTVFAGGFTNLVDLAFDATGGLYVLEHDVDGLLAPGTDGAISRIAPDGTVQRVALPAGTLTAPGGITVAPDGHLLVTVNATKPGLGQVLHIAL